MAKQNKGLRGAIILVLVAIIMVPCYFLIREIISEKTSVRVELYYLMSNEKMKPMEKEIAAGELEEMVTAVLNELQSGARPEEAHVAIPTNLEITLKDMDDGIVTLNISDEYNDMTALEEVICRSSIVWSLTSLEGVDHIIIEVDGEPLISKNGVEYSVLNRQNVLIDSVVDATTTEYAILQLYFANEDALGLEVEERVVEVDSNQATEKAVLEQLIAGPEEEGHYRTVPAETKIRDITITADGICYVNLSQEFVSKHGGGTTGEALTIYSIVNSLCKLDGIDKVQFLVEGEKMETYKGHFIFNKPIEADFNLWEE